MQTTATFKLTPRQYGEFWFRLRKATRIEVTLIATEPVNLLLFDDEQLETYKDKRFASYQYTEAWARKSDIDASIKLDAGRWHFVVEGWRVESKGKILIST